MANPISVPGTVVPSGSLISPGGAQGLQGLQGTTALADITQNGLLRQVSGNTTDFIDGTNNSQPLQPVITAVRLRSFNAVGNPNFEVNQRRTTGTMQANTSQWITDRWLGYNTTGVTPFWGVSTGQTITVPGTNFMISQAMLQFSTASVSKPSLAATDQTIVNQTVEGSAMRELINDVHSISVLAQTNVAGGLKFALLLQDSGTTRTLAKLCTISSPNIWTLIQLPNLPVFASGGSWSVTPGSVGYNLIISVAAGSTQIAPANDTWQNGNFRGAVGMDNILSKPSNSQLWIAFVQHEPGAVCSTLMDVPFSGPNGNLNACARYFQKSYDYATTPGTASVSNGQIQASVPAGGQPVTIPVFFNPRMAKVPTVTAYSATTGAINTVRDASAGIDRTTNTGGWGAGETGFSGFGTTTTNAGVAQYDFHYTADVGW